MTTDLFERACDRVSCEEVASRATKLRQRRGVCPLRDCGSKSKGTPFWIANGGRHWKCFSCDPQGGDVVDLERRLFSKVGETMADAARRLLGDDVREESASAKAEREASRKRREEEAMADSEWKAELARRLWSRGVPAAGTLVQTYLESRGIYGPVAARALGQLRFNPRAYHSGDPEFGVFLPAMVALITNEFGATGGVHVTYLALDGKGKTHRDGAKKMWGPQGSMTPEGSGCPGGIWLTRPDAEGPLVVAEGIESALSRAILKAGDLSLPVRAAAAGSLDRLQGFELIDKDGARDVWSPKGDPRRPPFTWPEKAEAPWGEVDIAVDNDMSPLFDIKGRTGRGRLANYTRDGMERARVCGRLAIAAWSARLVEGSATKVRASRPPLGRDFNIELRAVQTAGETGASA